MFLSVDSRQIPHNPLHKAFKAKSFTNKDITLHFYILDLLADGCALSCREIVDRISGEYLSRFSGTFSLDESTVRKKLKEYEELGLLQAEKNGREVFYRRTDGGPFPLDSWADALAFYSEEDPMGVVGSFLMDKLDEGPDVFRFKHHYILHALDSDILCQLLQAIGGEERQYDVYLGYQAKFDRHPWGVSAGAGHSLKHIEMTVRFGPGEDFIVQRLELTCSNQLVTDTFYEDLRRMSALYGGGGDAVP